MAIQISYRFNLVHLAIKLDFIAFHDFLYCFSNITYPYINTSCLDPSICCVFNCLQQLIKLGIKSYCECAVYQKPSDMGSKVDLANIVFLQNGLVTWVWCIMSCTMVERAAGRECLTCFNAISFNESSVCLFNLIAQIYQLNSWFGY